MKKEVSIVLVDSRHYRVIAQENWGLTKEQMKGKHVHHRIAQSDGGTDDPSNLYVCSPSFHRWVWHSGEEFVEAASRGGRLGGLKGGKRIAEERIGICSPEYLRSEKKREASRKAGRAGRGVKKPGSGPRPHSIEVILPNGQFLTFQSREEVCNFYDLSPSTLSYYLRQSCTLTKGKYRGYTFRFKGGWRRFDTKNNG